MDEITYALLRSVFAEQWSSTRMADLVYGLTGVLCRLPGATLLFSSDGRNWTDRSDAAPSDFDSITWGNGRFVALADDFYSSTNGLV